MAAHDYRVTILDNSMRQLQSERMVAEREDYPLLATQADMTAPFPFKDESFDVIIHPVSNCYIEDLQPTWNECYRVLRHGGVLMAGWTNPILYMFEDEALENRDLPLIVRNKLPLTAGGSGKGRGLRFDTGYQFVTHWKQRSGGSLRRASSQGFYEDSDRDPPGRFTPVFLRGHWQCSGRYNPIEFPA